MMLWMHLRLKKLPCININNLKWFQQQLVQDHHIPNSTNLVITTKIPSKTTDLNRATIME